MCDVYIYMEFRGDNIFNRKFVPYFNYHEFDSTITIGLLNRSGNASNACEINFHS
jgi:hypothetical protein